MNLKPVKKSMWQKPNILSDPVGLIFSHNFRLEVKANLIYTVLYRLFYFYACVVR